MNHHAIITYVFQAILGVSETGVYPEYSHFTLENDLPHSLRQIKLYPIIYDIYLSSIYLCIQLNTSMFLVSLFLDCSASKRCQIAVAKCIELIEQQVSDYSAQIRIRQHVSATWVAFHSPIFIYFTYIIHYKLQISREVQDFLMLAVIVHEPRPLERRMICNFWALLEIISREACSMKEANPGKQTWFLLSCYGCNNYPGSGRAHKQVSFFGRNDHFTTAKKY